MTSHPRTRQDIVTVVTHEARVARRASLRVEWTTYPANDGREPFVVQNRTYTNGPAEWHFATFYPSDQDPFVAFGFSYRGDKS